MSQEPYRLSQEMSQSQQAMYGQPQPGYGQGQQVMQGQQHQMYAMPPPAQVTQVVIEQPQPRNNLILAPPRGERDWSTGLFSCFEDCGLAAKAVCCTSCLQSDINARAGECGMVYCIVPGADITVRTKIRTMGGIRGSMVGDCCTMYWCWMCALCQEERELRAMGL